MSSSGSNYLYNSSVKSIKTEQCLICYRKDAYVDYNSIHNGHYWLGTLSVSLYYEMNESHPLPCDPMA